MKKYGDYAPLLVETNDDNPIYRRDGITTFIQRNGNIHNRINRGVSFGMIKLFICLICGLFITLSLIWIANYRISSKLDKLNQVPTTKSYRMLTERHRFTRRHTSNIEVFRQRFTKKTTTILPSIRKPKTETFKGEWQCGTAAISKQVTRSLIERDCPAQMDAVNSCCIVHDQCYDEQLGQLECDSGFCNCLDSVTLDKPKCHDDHSPWFCEMVKAFGDSFYDNAGLNTTLHSGFIDIFGIEAVEELNVRRAKSRQTRI